MTEPRGQGDEVTSVPPAGGGAAWDGGGGDGGVASWFASEEALVTELRRARPSAGVPEIAGYENLREIARGGQGVVYSATQRSTRRAVAVKVLLDSALSAGTARRRFEREIDLVASLKHPGIVSVYDSGLTADGRLYLVMEFVEGLPLDEALRGGKAGGVAEPRAAAGMIASVADAVQYAHQRGVIHRDLKPSNVRVDGLGSPRVLDFGLAKVAGGLSGGEGPAVTQMSMAGQFMGSLPWASPEQAAGDADRVDVRTDVYAMGVVLYQALTGRLPISQEGGLKTVLDRIVTEEPAKVRAVRPEVDEDLSTIVHTALAKEPERRYQSAGEMASDLRRYLAGEPIWARRDSTWYGLRKGLRRYRIATIAASVVVAATVAALVVSLGALERARAERDRANEQSEVARSERDRANEQSEVARARTARSEAVTQFLKDTLLAADPGSKGKDIRVVDILEPAGAQALESLKDQPEALASVRAVLSAAYRNLQIPDKSEQEARAGLAVVEEKLGGKGREAAEVRTALAATLMDLNKIDEAVGLAQRAIEDAAGSVGKESAIYLEAVQTYASLMDLKGNREESERLKRELIALMSARFGRDSAEALGAIGNLGFSLYRQGRAKEAIEVLEDCVERSRRALGPDHIATLAPMSTLASAYGAVGELEKAGPLHKEGWERLSARYGSDSPNALTFASNYANYLYSVGRVEEAKPIAEGVVEGFTRVYGPEHVSVVRGMTLLGSIYGKLGDNPRQIETQRKAIEIAERTLGLREPTWYYMANNYAQALAKGGQLEESMAVSRRAIDGADAVFGEKHSMPSTLWYNYAVVLKKAGRPAADRLGLLERACVRFEASLGAKSDWTIDAVKEYAATLEEAGRGAEVEAWRERVPGAFGGEGPQEK